jgi:hypothetical protein
MVYSGYRNCAVQKADPLTAAQPNQPSQYRLSGSEQSTQASLLFRKPSIESDCARLRGHYSVSRNGEIHRGTKILAELCERRSPHPFHSMLLLQNRSGWTTFKTEATEPPADKRQDFLDLLAPFVHCAFDLAWPTC